MKISLFFMVVALLGAAISAAEPSDLERRLLAASGELRIADTVGSDPVVRQAALGWAAANRNVSISVEQAALTDVAGDQKKVEYDVVVYQYDPHCESDVIPAGNSTDYAVEAALIYVNRENRIDNITVTALAEMFSNDAASWEKINGDKRSPRRYGVVRPAAGELPFQRLTLGKTPYAGAMLFVGTTMEVVAGVAGSSAAIGVGGYSYALPKSVKVLSVNDVAPSPENLSSGKYPLVLKRAVAVNGNCPLAALFAELLVSPEVGALAAEAELFPLSAPGSQI